MDGTSRNVAAALAIYHLAPMVRAVSRLVQGGKEYGKGLGGPIVHMIVHAGTFAGLMSLYFQAL